MMQEHARLKSIKWLGIKPLQSRFQLPGAKASYPVAEQESNPSHDTKVSSIPVTQAHSILEKQSTDTLSSLSASSNSARASLKVESATSLPTPQAAKNEAIVAQSFKSGDAQQTLKFRLRFLHLSSLLFVLPQPKLMWQDEKNQRLFMHDIYKALFREDPNYQHTDVFNWPPFKESNYGNDKKTAKETLTNFCRGLFENQSTDLMITFGLKIDDYFSVVSENDQGIFTINDNTRVVNAMSIDSYFLSPASTKPVLWKQLQAAKF